MNKIHRYISFFLCLSLILLCLSPTRAYAVVNPAYSSAYAVVGGVAVEGFKEGAKLIASALASVWNKVFTYDFLQTCQGVLEIGSFFTDPIGHKAVFDSYSEGELSAGQVVLTKSFMSSVAAAYKTKTGLTLTVPDEEVTIYVPPESVWSEAELITAYRLNTQGFADLTEVNKNILAGNQITWQLHKDLDSLELYLRTTFVETLGSEFDSLSSSLGSILSRINSNLVSKLNTLDVSLGSIETSIDVMESTLHTDLTHLKSSYASFGNATLDKLDTLNTSIQNLESYDSSKDFADLKSLYSSFGNATLDELGLLNESVDSLPDKISQYLDTIYDPQYLQLEAISSKLGNDISFLESLLTVSSGIWDELSYGFEDVVRSLDSLEDVVTSLDSLDVSASIDLQPLIAYLDGYSEDLYNLSTNSYFILSSLTEDIAVTLDSLNVSISEEFSYTNRLLGSYFDTLFAMPFDMVINDIHFYIMEIVDRLDFVDVSISNLESSINSSFTNLKDELLESLADLKTSVQSLAGTTTAGPGSGDDDSQDEANKQKIPLIPHINNGFQQGENYIGNVYTFLDDELAGFRVAALIFEEFAGISFFYKLIITSCSVGLIATLLGMTLYAQSFNLWTRRREEAAQARAQYRMQRSTAA